MKLNLKKIKKITFGIIGGIWEIIFLTAYLIKTGIFLPIDSLTEFFAAKTIKDKITMLLCAIISFCVEGFIIIVLSHPPKNVGKLEHWEMKIETNSSYPTNSQIMKFYNKCRNSGFDFDFEVDKESANAIDNMLNKRSWFVNCYYYVNDKKDKK